MLFEFIALGAFAGVVVFAVLFNLLALKDGPWKIAAIGMFACFLVVLVMGILMVLGVGESGSAKSGANISRGLFNVTLTIPPDYVEAGLTQEDLDQDVEEKGFKSATLNEDGSVTYVMKKALHRELVAEIKRSIDESLAELSGSAQASNIARIEANGDYTEYQVVLTSDEIGLLDAFVPAALYLDSGMYHTFNGTAPDNIRIQYVNEATGDVLHELNSKDLEAEPPDLGTEPSAEPDGAE